MDHIIFQKNLPMNHELNVLREISQNLKFYHLDLNKQKKLQNLLGNLNEVEHLHIQRQIFFLPYLLQFVQFDQHIDSPHIIFY